MYKYRAEITKDEEIRYISHLDYMSLLERAICRSKLPASYSEGFNPHMKISFASALAVGVTSDAEYMELELKEKMPSGEVKASLAATLPSGVKIKRVKQLHGKPRALMAVADLASYKICIPFYGEVAMLINALESFNEAKEVIFKRITPKKIREIEVKKFIKGKLRFDVKEKEVEIFINIIITPSGSIKPSEILEILVSKYNLSVDKNEALIHRERLLGEGKPLLDLD